MFFQFLLALYFGFACPSQPSPHCGDSPVITTPTLPATTNPDGPGGTGGEGGQIDPPK